MVPQGLAGVGNGPRGRPVGMGADRPRLEGPLPQVRRTGGRRPVRLNPTSHRDADPGASPAALPCPCMTSLPVPAALPGRPHVSAAWFTVNRPPWFTVNQRTWFTVNHAAGR